MKKTVMKIDKIELKFKKRNSQIQSIEEFSKEFDNGFYFVEHPDVITGTRVVMHVTSNFKNDTFSFDFNRKDIEWGHYWVDKLVQKWTIIWEWFYQTDLVTNKSYILGEEDIKKRFGEQSQEYRELSSFNSIPINLVFEETSDSEINYNNMDWVLDFDERNSFERMKTEKIYYDNDLKVWIDLEYSLPAIKQIIRVVDFHG
ncbi:hypothetical protein [Exiguobacterium sp. RIT594]|uniref:hypothetical protein n=1 Tax=Exiguobacterium sp. RIT594 TaxID=2282449 RepID=UPI000DF80BCE|nr:hypothetical protein [Exiguobacterium sp. RIT594]RDB34320.1 hypothetical protein DVG79_06480 [Exiguobacterium sp. RIT594]